MNLINKKNNIKEKYIKLKINLYMIIVFISFSLQANEFNYKSTGTLIRNEEVIFPNGGKFISFKHAGGFETDIGKYGKYQCNGSILYNNKSTLENMYFACEFKDQNGDTFITMGKRLKGSDMDRAVGQFELVDGNRFWKNYVGYKCSYAVEYVDNIVFAPVKCKI